MARREKGQSLVELALTLPVVLLLLTGVVDLGFVLYAHIQVASATGEASRVAAHFVGDATANCGNNDTARLTLVKKAVYDSTVSPATSSLGRLSPTSPYFGIGSYTAANAGDDVWIDGYAACGAGTETRSGQEMVVHVRYREPVLFGAIPGLSSMRFTLSSAARVRIP
ncbi:MAG TPA: TadE/TadG family type IV pilus assembly protein [Chloroflexota bacterium]|nr:TadE/TadG family type IV pilus assembly protein [Chloroflexota bacterium]